MAIVRAQEVKGPIDGQVQPNRRSKIWQVYSKRVRKGIVQCNGGDI